MKTIIFLLIGIISSAHTFADDCDFLPKPAPSWADAGFETQERNQCKALTNESINQGRPLTIHQLEEARSELSKNFQRDSIWGLSQLGTLDRKVDCMIVNGNMRICHCLASNLPVILSFSGLVYFSGTENNFNILECSYYPKGFCDILGHFIDFYRLDHLFLFICIGIPITYHTELYFCHSSLYFLC